MADSKDVVRKAWEAIAARDWDALDVFFAPNYVRHTARADLAYHEFRELVQAEHAAFSDLSFELDGFVVEDGAVAFRWESVGTHTGPYLGVPATGKSVRCWGITISRVESGQIQEDWASWNKYDVLYALGITPIDGR
jgi:steroid delta-isomerase-like uncharacterized protein